MLSSSQKTALPTTTVRLYSTARVITHSHWKCMRIVNYDEDNTHYIDGDGISIGNGNELGHMVMAPTVMLISIAMELAMAKVETKMT